MQRTDRWLGLALALLAAAVLWSARTFPAVPGQKLGAGFLPTLVGSALLLCGVALLVRSWRAERRAAAAPLPRAAEQIGSAMALVGVIAGYILLADRLGFLIVAPLALLASFRSLRVAWRPSLGWALGGTLVVHVAFYKLLRVPLPWGVLRPFY